MNNSKKNELRKKKKIGRIEGRTIGQTSPLIAIRNREIHCETKGKSSELWPSGEVKKSKLYKLVIKARYLKPEFPNKSFAIPFSF